MQIDTKPSPDIIDRRRGAVAGVVASLFVVFATWFGIDLRKPDPDQDLVNVTATALDRGQAFWSGQVSNYRKTKVVLFTGISPTPCGQADVLSGPFYCPADEHIYLELSFLRAINGDLARAYVIAHELGHHVQKLRGQISDSDSIKVELGADRYAGCWMRSENSSGHLADGDIPGALAEAAAVGDDRICPTCSPEQWTHGSAAQRDTAVMTGVNGSCQ